MTQMGKANTIIKKILQAKITFEVQMELFFHAQLGMINGEMIQQLLSQDRVLRLIQDLERMAMITRKKKLQKDYLPRCQRKLHLIRVSLVKLIRKILQKYLDQARISTSMTIETLLPAEICTRSTNKGPQLSVKALRSLRLALK